MLINIQSVWYSTYLEAAYGGGTEGVRVGLAAARTGGHHKCLVFGPDLIRGG
jgi:hypothetical protein